MRACRRIAVLLCCIATVSGAHADDVIDQINEALQAYQNHDTQTAITALDAASNLLRQSRADSRIHRGQRGNARRRYHREPRLS
jgi:hypothetical protein